MLRDMSHVAVHDGTIINGTAVQDAYYLGVAQGQKAATVLADRHYMQRGSGSNIVLGEADGLYDAAAACLAVGWFVGEAIS